LFIRKESDQGIFNRHIPGQVMGDLKKAFEAFYDWYGAPAAKSLSVVDQPVYTGQSSPGLIHLSEVSFETNRDQGHFRSHEVAHQWWGHTIIPATIRDIWLSEGLSEFSSALYLLNAKHDTTQYMELVDCWRRQVLQTGLVDGQYSRGYRAGPISMGMRFLQSFSPGDYSALVYAKAAYMLQMLRFEIDGPSYRTDFFDAMLAEFVRTNRSRQATNADFVRDAAKYIGERRADIFFRTWLYDWKVPAYSCLWHLVRDTKNRPTVEISISVTGVSPTFETPFPVEIEYADGSKELFRLDNIGQGKSHTLGPFPQEIKTVRFDPDRIMLATDVEVVAP
jgi:aminopeptidase N